MVAPNTVTEPEKEIGRRDRADAAAPDPLDQVLEEVDETEGQQHLVERRPPVERAQQLALDSSAPMTPTDERRRRAGRARSLPVAAMSASPA